MMLKRIANEGLEPYRRSLPLHLPFCHYDNSMQNDRAESNRWLTDATAMRLLFPSN